MIAKPFLRWAGGKTQLLNILRNNYPSEPIKYAEPFVGGGAVLFDILQRHNFKEIFISDINSKLIYTYQVIRDSVGILIENLEFLEQKFKNAPDRKEFYLVQRQIFNETDESIYLAALMIFLNKTCFNGIYRVNRKGYFNVPFANPANPRILDADNLLRVSKLLQPVQIVCGDYFSAGDFIDSNTFAYFDPPYRPLTPTANFTAYSNVDFSDKDQIKLAGFVREMSERGARVMVSNSDPHNVDEDDDFFDNLYQGFQIERVSARRSVNRNGAKRGMISELLIKNF